MKYLKSLFESLTADEVTEKLQEIEKDKMINICSGIYDRLISSGYNCQLWEPGYQKFRFHISTPESNPFMMSKNSLKSE